MDGDVLAERFEEQRGRLWAVAYRMLGSPAEAEDAVQEAWLRLQRSDSSEVANLGGWLTTVVARVALDMLRSRRSRPEEPMGVRPPEALAGSTGEYDPEQEAVLADSVGPALLVVLDTLAPPERLAFVLHDLFGVPFEEIAPIVGRNATATRQLASRARRRVRGVGPERDPDRGRQREVVAAFLSAARGGDFDALLRLLDPDVVVRPDEVAARSGAGPEIRGAREVAAAYAGRAKAARLALLDGAPGLVWMYRGETRMLFVFTVAGGRITGITLAADPARIAGTAIELLPVSHDS